MSNGCVVLAAGGSQRLGHAKQLVRLEGEMLEGETLLDRAVRVAKSARCSPIVVVLGAAAKDIVRECALGGVTVVHNEAWADGMSGSIRIGISALPEEVEVAIVMTCDQPAVSAAHLRRLIDLCLATQAGQTAPIASRYAGRNGVPACFPAAMFPELMRIEGDYGARKMLADADSVALPHGDVDVDTPESLEHARRVLVDLG